MAGILLWENPNENASMPETLITLSSADYDYYEIYYKQIVSNKRMMHQKAFKGYDCFLNFASVSGSGSMSNRRVVYFVSDTSMNVYLWIDLSNCPNLAILLLHFRFGKLSLSIQKILFASVKYPTKTYVFLKDAIIR